MSAADWLAEQRRIEQAATEGGWRAAVVARYVDDDGCERGKGAIYPAGPMGPPPLFVTPDWVAADAEFVATARTALPKALDALEAVLALWPDADPCDCCVHVDCEVVRAIAKALGVESRPPRSAPHTTAAQPPSPPDAPRSPRTSAGCVTRESTPSAPPSALGSRPTHSPRTSSGSASNGPPLAPHKGDSMPDLIITEALVERCARAMYEASIANAGPHRDTWDDLPAYWRATLTTQARACLTAALHPTPTPGPLDGQEPLIGEPA